MIEHILLEVSPLAETGTLSVQLDRRIEIKVSAVEARRRANHYAHLEISTQLHAEAPLLVVGQTVFWRVPIHLTFPSWGDLGQVGSLHVDPVSGDLLQITSAVQEIMHNADQLAQRFTSQAAH